MKGIVRLVLALVAAACFAGGPTATAAATATVRRLWVSTLITATDNGRSRYYLLIDSAAPMRRLRLAWLWPKGERHSTIRPLGWVVRGVAGRRSARIALSFAYAYAAPTGVVVTVETGGGRTYSFRDVPWLE